MNMLVAKERDASTIGMPTSDRAAFILAVLHDIAHKCMFKQ